MCPTSIAVWNVRWPPHIGQASPSTDWRISASRAVKSRPCSTPRRCQPVRFAPATNWPFRNVSSATISPLNPTGPSEPGSAPNAARISSSVAGRNALPSTAASLASSSRSSPRIRARTTVPSSFVTGIAFEVAAASMPRNPASASIVAIPGVADLERLVERLGELRCARHAARDLEVGGVVAVLAGDERVLTRTRRRQVVDRLRATHHPRLGLHRNRLDPAALEDAVVGALVPSEARPPGPPRRGRTSRSPS